MQRNQQERARGGKIDDIAGEPGLIDQACGQWRDRFAEPQLDTGRCGLENRAAGRRRRGESCVRLCRAGAPHDDRDGKKGHHKQDCGPACDAFERGWHGT